MANGVYTFEGFIHAVAKFPAFCAENNIASADEDTTCGRELAALFAHMVHESGLHDPYDPTPAWQQGLYHAEEPQCTSTGAGAGTSACDYKSTD